jgi:ubiquinone/menaquinone biosynthesis C-methylase UbiE
LNIHAFYRPILQHFRKNRMKRFSELFVLSGASVLDIGGGTFNWLLMDSRPERLTVLNVCDEQDKAPWAAYIVGDGCATGLPDAAFDIVFSNSVIEHVGGIERQRQFAKECMRCGRSYFIQTPNKWFPVDPHTLMLFAHWFPQRIFKKLLPLSPRFMFFETDAGDKEDFGNMRLLSKDDLQELFPAAEIIEEKFLGITKSFIAVSAAPCRDRQKDPVPVLSSFDSEASEKQVNR